MFFLYFFRFSLFFSFACVVSLLVFFGFSFAKGSLEKKLGDGRLVATADEHDSFSEFVVENDKGRDVFVDFPEDFDEKNILPLRKDVGEKSQNSSQIEGKSRQKRKVNPLKKKVFRGKYRAKSKKKRINSRAKLAKVSKLYYERNFVKLTKLHFTKYELDMLFFKAMAYRALAFQDDEGKRNSSQAKKLLNKIASKAKDKKLKEKSLLWMGITEWQFPTLGKSLLSRIYPLHYLQRKIERSRASNDADLYIAFFYEQNNDYERAKNHYRRLMKSDKDDLVYDVNVKKFIPPREAAEYYLAAIQDDNLNIASKNEKKVDKKPDLVQNVEEQKKEKKVEKVRAAMLPDKVKEKSFDEIKKKLEAFKNFSSSPQKTEDDEAEKEQSAADEVEKKNQEQNQEFLEEKTDDVNQGRDAQKTGEKKSPKGESEKEEQFVEINSEKKDSSVTDKKEVEQEFFFE